MLHFKHLPNSPFRYLCIWYWRPILCFTFLVFFFWRRFLLCRFHIQLFNCSAVAVGAHFCRHILLCRQRIVITLFALVSNVHRSLPVSPNSLEKKPPNCVFPSLRLVLRLRLTHCFRCIVSFFQRLNFIFNVYRWSFHKITFDLVSKSNLFFF